jgi:hypothetical protein
MIHKGQNSTSGHYVSNVKLRDLENKNQFSWYEFDDNIPTKKIKLIESSKDVSCLIYVRQDKML